MKTFSSSARSLGVARLSVAALAVLASCATPHPSREPPPQRPVRIEVVEAGEFRPTLLLLGRLAPAESVPVAVRASGYLRPAERHRPALRTGVEVEDGEVLATIENATITSALAEAEIEERRREATFEAVARSHAQGLVADLDRESAELDLRLARERRVRASRRVADLTVRAPRTGLLVVEEGVGDGTNLAEGAVLALVAAAGPARIDAHAAASDRRWLWPGLPAELRRPGGESIGRATLRELAPVVDEAGTVRVVLVATELQADTIPGEGVEVIVELKQRPSALTVPETALVAGEGGSAVYVVEGGVSMLSVRRVSVETGLRGNGRVEVTRGLGEGDRVVVAGAAFVRDGDDVLLVDDESSD